MAEGAGEVAFEDVGVEVCLLAAANGLDEVGKMVAAAGKLLDFLALLVVGNGVGIAGHEHPAIFAVNDDANAGQRQSARDDEAAEDRLRRAEREAYAELATLPPDVVGHHAVHANHGQQAIYRTAKHK